MKDRARRILRQSGVLSDPFRDTMEAVVATRTRECRDAPRVLDVGCGNHSPSKFKSAFDVYYVGVDIQEYHLDETDRQVADELVILDCSSGEYTERLRQAFESRHFDAISMRHVIEHLENPLETLQVLVDLLADDGVLFLTFPCEASTSFPRGSNSTLNFHDDPTHIWLPDLAAIQKTLSERCEIETLIPRYHGGPVAGTISRLISFPTLLLSRATKRPVHVNGHTWRAVGFETVVVARRRADSQHPGVAAGRTSQ